jgi:hypothetical protein
MADQLQQPPVTNPDNVPETLCNGPFYLSFQGGGDTSIAVLTLTNVRPDADPMFQRNTINDRAIVRARIAMSIPNLVALRDLLANNVKTDAVPIAGAGSVVRH